MRKKEIISIQTEQTSHILCDCCRMEVEGKNAPDDWYSFCAQHFGWGNDSIESVERYDVCSPECFLRVITKCVEEFKSQDSSEIADMPILFAKRLIELFTKKL